MEKLHIGPAQQSFPHHLRRTDLELRAPEAEEWLKQAKENLKDARAMLRSHRYVFAAFACHLAVEKALKAVIAERTGAPPPRRHNLLELANIGRAALTQAELQFVAALSMAALGARYPDTLSQALKDYPRPVVDGYVRKVGSGA